MPTKRKFFLDHPARQGEIAEMRFMTRATEMGLLVTKPWGANSRYDFVVESRGRFSRVQVKSTVRRMGNQYVCNAHPEKHAPYSDHEVDFIAVYLFPEDLWYILPSVEQKPCANFSITPSRPGHKYEQYKEAWHLLLGSPAELPERSGTSVAVIAGKLAQETAGISLIGKNAAAVALGRRGGQKGGKERARRYTPRERSEMARQAALRRWQREDENLEDNR